MDERLRKLYDEMWEDLNNEIEALGGTIDSFIPEEKMIAITVDPEYQKYMEKILSVLVAKYEKKKDELLGTLPFSGVRNVLRNLNQ